MRKEVSFRERIVPWLFLAPSLIFVTDDLLIDKEIRYDENNICRI